VGCGIEQAHSGSSSTSMARARPPVNAPCPRPQTGLPPSAACARVSAPGSPSAQTGEERRQRGIGFKYSAVYRSAGLLRLPEFTKQFSVRVSCTGVQWRQPTHLPGFPVEQHMAEGVGIQRHLIAQRKRLFYC
jgi:hypothetical protein